MTNSFVEAGTRNDSNFSLLTSMLSRLRADHLDMQTHSAVFVNEEHPSSPLDSSAENYKNILGVFTNKSTLTIHVQHFLSTLQGDIMIKELPSSNNYTSYNVVPNHLLGSTDVIDLAWLIPVIIAGVVFMIILALLCFYGVRATELKIMNFCSQSCGCCCAQDVPRTSRSELSGGETQPLTANPEANLELKDYRTYKDSTPFDDDYVI